jgi:glycosyltransferase involved in cell wall biosynthesis
VSRRLLSISHSYVVGLNRALPNALARLGWDVTVVAPPFFRGDLRPIVLERESHEPADLQPVPMIASRRPHVMAWSRRLRDVLDSDWDVVHVWEEPYVLAGAQVARWRRRGALVYATFQNISKRYPPPFGWLERYAMARAQGWVAFGHTVAAALDGRRGYAGRPHRVIPPAVDLERFTPDDTARHGIRQELGFAAADVVVGFAGRFVVEKGLATLMAALDGVDAFRGRDAAGLPWRSLFVGGGVMEPDLRRWAAPRGERVRIATDVTHAGMARYLAAMDVLVVPSRTTPHWREQFGRVIVEAMACGVPVIGSDSGEIPHVIADAGVIVREDDVPAWVSAIASLCRDPEQRIALRARGLARAQAFSVRAAAEAHARFFEELLAS